MRIVRALRDEEAEHAALAESQQDERRRRLSWAFDVLAQPTFNDLLDWLIQHQRHARDKSPPEDRARDLARCVGGFEPLTEWEARGKGERDEILDSIARQAKALAGLIEAERPPLPPAWTMAAWAIDLVGPDGKVPLDSWRAVEEHGVEVILRRLARNATALKRRPSRNLRPKVGGPGGPLARALAPVIVDWFWRSYTAKPPQELIANLVQSAVRELHGFEVDVTGEQIRQLLKERRRPVVRSRRLGG